mmetsp:Transcript_57821/g.118353  ORF Transcript_57821/g.118353 Transcript_57821/m.118353 type:complete len:201 (+) Transcript_57821:199-801(+)
MGEGAVPERVDVRRQLGGGDALGLALLAEQRDVVHPLRPRHDLLAAHEDVIGVGVVGVVGARHRVERPYLHGEALEDPEVGAILLLHQLPQVPLLMRLKVLEFFDVSLVGHAGAVLGVRGARCTQHRNRLGELEAEVLVLGVLQRLHRILLADYLYFALEVVLEALEDLDHEEVRHVQRLSVALIDLHFEIQPRELRQVT